MALSADAVANLISNLRRRDTSKNIEIKEATQDETIKDMQAFQFIVDLREGEVLGEEANEYGKLWGKCRGRSNGRRCSWEQWC